MAIATTTAWPAVDVAGSYTASVAAATTSGSGEFDLLAIGATVTATLGSNGTTSGRLQVPGGVGGAPAVDEDLAGTWSLSGTTVTFSPSASSLLSDVDFAVGQNTLTGEGIYQGAMLLVLTDESGSRRLTPLPLLAAGLAIYFGARILSRRRQRNVIRLRGGGQRA